MFYYKLIVTNLIDLWAKLIILDDSFASIE